MSKGYTKRKVKFYGGNDSPTIEISIGVYAHGQLTADEIKRLGDALADDAMRSISTSPFTKAPLSRILVEKNPKQ